MITTEQLQQYLDERRGNNSSDSTPEHLQQYLDERRAAGGQQPQQQQQPDNSLWGQVKAAPGQLGDYIVDVGKGSVAFGKEMRRDPISTASRAIGKGAENYAILARNFVNLPRNMQKMYRDQYPNGGGPLEMMHPQLSKMLGGQDLPNIPEKDIGKQLGVEGNLPQDAATDLFFNMLTPGLGIEKGASMAARIGKRVTEGGAYGATSSPDNIISSAFAGGVIPLPIDALKGIAGAKNIPLKYIKRKADKHGAFTPEQTQEHIDTHYLDEKGDPIKGIDIGTLTNEPVLKGTYKGTSAVPLSGGRTQKDAVKNQLRAVDDAKALEAMSADKRDADAELNDAIQNQQNFAKVGEDSEINPDMITEGLRASQENISNAQEHGQNSIDVLQALKKPGDELSGKVSKDDLAKAFKGAKNEAKNIYAPLDREKMLIKNISTKDDFPTFSDAMEDLEKSSGEFADVFEDESAIKDANKILKNGMDFANGDGRDVNIAAIRDQVQHFQRLGESAKKSGNYKASTKFFRAASALKSDAQKILRDNGLNDISDAWDKGNAHHISQVLPFYKNKAIRDAVMDPNHIPNATEISQKLHDPNYQSILNRHSDPAKKNALYNLINKDGGESSGRHTMTAKEISTVYKKLTNTVKKAIRDYSPEHDDHFQTLGNVIRHSENSKKNVDFFQKALDEHNKKRLDAENISEKNADALRVASDERTDKHAAADKRYKDYQEAQQPERISTKRTGSGDLSSNVYHVLKAVLMASALAAPKAVASATGVAAIANKILTNPELLRKYLSGERYQPSSKIDKSSDAMARAMRNVAQNRGDQ